MEKEKRHLSSKVLFSAVEEQLSCSRQASFTVTGMSMWPFLCHGRDQVIIEAAIPSALRKGDILLFRATEEKFLLHRITRLRPDGFETTGDGNLFRDGCFPYTCVIGKVTKAVRKGKLIDCDRKTWRILSHVWMTLYPVRRYLFASWKIIRRRKAAAS